MFNPLVFLAKEIRKKLWIYNKKKFMIELSETNPSDEIDFGYI